MAPSESAARRGAGALAAGLVRICGGLDGTGARVTGACGGRCGTGAGFGRACGGLAAGLAWTCGAGAAGLVCGATVGWAATVGPVPCAPMVMIALHFEHLNRDPGAGADPKSNAVLQDGHVV
jgi:hypothetical protein